MTAESEFEVYGRLFEGVNVTGYTFERVFTNLDWMLNSDRWRLGGRFADINEFLASIGFEKFRLLAEDRTRIATKIKALHPDASNRQIAKTLGVDEKTVRNDSAGESKKANKSSGGNSIGAENSAPPPISLPGDEAEKNAQKRAARKERDSAAEDKKIEEAKAVADLTAVTAEMREGKFQQALADLREVDAIITDPPYEKEALSELSDLAGWSNTVLKKDGILAVLYGETYLPEAFARLAGGGRPYRWTACYLTDGPGYVSHPRKVQSNWKPLLIYGGNEPRFSDLFKSSGDAAAKDRHKWGQNFDAFKDIVERLTKPGALIVDPFAGGGTTLLAAKASGRNSIGCDVDPECVKKAKEVLA